MSNDLKQKAKEYLKLQLSVIPTKEDKRPAIEWKPYQSQRIEEKEVESVFTGASIKGLGIVCGAVSGNLEVIDVDCKYDSTGSLWEELSSVIEGNLPDLYKRLVIAQTKNKGYHIYYKCTSIQRSFKLANRYTTLDEKEQTYQKEIKKEEPEHIARGRAENDKVRVLIETRGEGGLVVAPPSPGYKYIQGEPSTIPTLSVEDRASLFRIARSFNEAEEQAPREIISIKKSLYDFSGLSPWKDYDERGNVIELLQSEGWKVVNQRGERIHLLRPGSTDSATSGNFHTGLRVLKIFSTSSEQFSPDRGYSPSQVFTILKCNGDSSLAGRKLRALGYGEPYTTKQTKTERIKVESVNEVNRETSVISTPGEALKFEALISSAGDKIVITSPGPEALEETLRAIDLSLQTGKKIYIKEGELEIREYKYTLQALFNKNGALLESKGYLTDREIDSLLDEVVQFSTKLQPIDAELYTKHFLTSEGVPELGISEEALAITRDRLAVTKEKESQATDLKRLLSEATQRQAKGEIESALDLLDTELKEVKLKNKATEFKSLLLTTSEAKVMEEEAHLPNSLETGIIIHDTELELPGGAISIYAAPTNHGKTILLINTVLNVAQKYPDKRFIFFTYEESGNAILQYFLNTFTDCELNNSNSNKSNRKIYKEFFKTGSTQYISSSNLNHFRDKKEEFFRDYIETGRIIIKYVDYNSKDLTSAISYLHKEAKNLGGVFIDYMQLINLPGGTKREERINNRQEELKLICMSLKDTAVKTGLPLVLAAQFNREVTNLMRLHPTHIGEAGDIERIVSTLVGVWNMDKKEVLKGIVDHELQAINERLRVRGVKGDGSKNMYLEILKSRDLPTGFFDFLDFNGRTGKLKNRGDNTGDELIKEFK
jgi:replicative DNA helicase